MTSPVVTCCGPKMGTHRVYKHFYYHTTKFSRFQYFARKFYGEKKKHSIRAAILPFFGGSIREKREKLSFPQAIFLQVA